MSTISLGEYSGSASFEGTRPVATRAAVTEFSVSSWGARILRRVFSFSVAGLGLIVSLPVVFLIALRLKSEKGDVLFRQTRIGKGGKPFLMYKFRTMVFDAEQRKRELENLATCDRLFKVKDDPRVTPFGRFLRRYNLDEIPQFVNVLKGDMNIAGPRPSLAEEVERYEAAHLERLAVKPGITGLWQVDENRRWVFEEMVALDIRYIRRRSLLLDLKILARTPKTVIRGTRWHI